MDLQIYSIFMILRSAERLISQVATEFSAITVTGPRQSGKTTILRKLFSHATYIHLEEPDILASAKQDPKGFLHFHIHKNRVIILDEIQYCPELLPYIKRMIDEERNLKGRFFLTGSQNFQLMQSMSESLAGRTFVFELFPLSMLELSQEMNIENVMMKGFYPQLWADPAFVELSSVHRWMGSYVRNFIEKDIRRIGNIEDIYQFENFVRLLAARSGSLLNIAELARSAQISETTAKRWLSLSTSGYLVFETLPYHQNFSKRITKSRKMYFVDIGLCRYLVGFSQFEALRLSPYFGSFFESMVVADIKKNLENQGLQTPLYFFRSSDGIEVDVIIERENQRVAFEIKATETPTLSQTKGLRKFISLHKKTQGFVLCNVSEPTPLGEGIIAIPWSKNNEILFL